MSGNAVRCEFFYFQLHTINFADMQIFGKIRKHFSKGWGQYKFETLVRVAE